MPHRGFGGTIAGHARTSSYKDAHGATSLLPLFDLDLCLKRRPGRASLAHAPTPPETQNDIAGFAGLARLILRQSEDLMPGDKVRFILRIAGAIEVCPLVNLRLLPDTHAVTRDFDAAEISGDQLAAGKRADQGARDVANHRHRLFVAAAQVIEIAGLLPPQSRLPDPSPQGVSNFASEGRRLRNGRASHRDNGSSRECDRHPPSSYAWCAASWPRDAHHRAATPSRDGPQAIDQLG